MVREASAMRLRFYFQVRTTSGGIVGNIVIEAHDQFEAQQKLMQRYPGCTIMKCEVR
jgi:hypothetical protein